MPPKTVSALETTPSTATFLSKLFGAVCVGSFVVIWINSIGAPIYLVISILHERYVLAAAITLVTMAAYLPWSKGPLSRSVSNFFHVYHSCYYKSVSVEFEGNVPSPSDKQTFYAIHPHGAFCIGWATLFTLPTMAHVVSWMLGLECWCPSRNICSHRNGLHCNLHPPDILLLASVVCIPLFQTFFTINRYSW
jgi:hypothetical protein